MTMAKFLGCKIKHYFCSGIFCNWVIFK